MSLGHQQMNQQGEVNKETFLSAINTSINKQQVSDFTSNGVSKVRDLYSDALSYSVNANSTMEYAGMKALSEKELPAGQIRSEIARQRELSMDRIKKESHSGKESKQERAANERKYFGDVGFHDDFASEIKNIYIEQKRTIETDGINPEKYKCTGKEFVIPLNLDEGIEEQLPEMKEAIVKVMIERDRLKGEIDSARKSNTPYGKALRKNQKLLLKYMNDVIDTFFLASGVRQEGERPVSEKTRNAAQNHMALAMEKYEMCARKFDENVALDMSTKVTEKRKYKETKQQSLRQGKDARKEKTDSIKDFLFQNRDAYAQHKEEIDKVLAEYINLIGGVDITNAHLQGYKDVITDPSNFSEEELENAQGLKNALDEHLGHVSRSIQSGANACKAYIEYLINGTKMSVFDATYIKGRFGFWDPTTISADLKMDQPLLRQKTGLTEYDTQVKTKIYNWLEEQEQRIANMTEAEKNENKRFINEVTVAAKSASTFSGVYKIYRKYVQGSNPIMDKKNELDDIAGNLEHPDHAVFRDVVIRSFSLKGEYEISPEEMKRIVQDTSNVIYGNRNQTDPSKAISLKTMKESFDRLMVYYKKGADELMEFRNNHPQLYDIDSENPDLVSILKDYEEYTIYAQKAQSLGDVMGYILENKEFVKSLSKEDIDECIRIGAIGKAINNAGNVWTNITNQLYGLTPNQVLKGEFNIKKLKIGSFNKTMQIYMNSVGNRYQKALNS